MSASPRGQLGGDGAHGAPRRLGRVIRDPLDLLRLVFLGGVVWFAAAGDLKGVGNLLIASGALIAARLANIPRPYDLGLIVAMTFTGWGEALGLYDAWAPYDNVVHFCVPMLTAPVAYICFARVEVLPDLRDETDFRRDAAIFLVTFALGLAIGALWEMLEYGSDQVFGSRLQLSNTDTVGDLMADGAGSLVGAALLVCWSRFGWGSVRRIPGTNHGEDTAA